MSPYLLLPRNSVLLQLDLTRPSLESVYSRPEQEYACLEKVLSWRWLVRRSSLPGHPIMVSREGSSHLKWVQYILFATFVLWACSRCCNHEACYGEDSTSNRVSHPRADASHNCWPTSVCLCQINPMAVTSVWSEQVRHDARHPLQWGGKTEFTWNPSGRQWVDQCCCWSRIGISWLSGVTLDCNQYQADSPSPDHSSLVCMV